METVAANDEPTTGAAASTPETTAAPAAEVTETKEAAATSVKPAGDLSEPTGSPAAEGLIEEEAGWGLFSYGFFLLVLVGGGFVFWRLGGLRFAKLLFSGRERAHYRRVSADLEK
ncbi:hypothetical protein OH77DRAFT_1175453 [Trametes cingulata]|nr:hypothetical protein OH77DRAFT_1175453 [Trametes cingulata]